jgi:hypothetical protein
MMGDVDEEVGDNDKNAMVWPEGAAWWDGFAMWFHLRKL